MNLGLLKVHGTIYSRDDVGIHFFATNCSVGCENSDLASDDASNVNGAILTADNGWFAAWMLISHQAAQDGLALFHSTSQGFF
jgi:hypothetical protein